jgi:hypothetical protein
VLKTKKPRKTKACDKQAGLASGSSRKSYGVMFEIQNISITKQFYPVFEWLWASYTKHFLLY